MPILITDCVAKVLNRRYFRTTAGQGEVIPQQFWEMFIRTVTQRYSKELDAR